MTDNDTYPPCLRRTDAGGHVQTRTTQTDDGYRKRYDGMARTWCRTHGQDVVTPFDLATDLGYRASGLSENALKQYHAVMRQHLRDLWDDGAISLGLIERIDALLRQQTPLPKPTKGKAGNKTSAGRAKSIKPEALSVLVTELLHRPTPIRQIAAAQLEHGVNLLTRPAEFLAMAETEPGLFRVPSAKYSQSNRRGLEPYRTLPTGDYSAFEHDDLRTVIVLIAQELADGATLFSIQRRCQNAIREARKALPGRRKIVAYTARHQGRANLAAMGMPPEEVAAIMGHASATTAQSHYAPARRAWKGMADAEPPAVDPDLVANVRPGNSSRGWGVQPQEQPEPKPR
jgi:hypothetical protein